MAVDVSKIDLSKFRLAGTEEFTGTPLSSPAVLNQAAAPRVLPQSPALEATLGQAFRLQPGPYAETARVAREAGVPTSTVRGDPEAVQARLKLDRINLDRMARRAPGTAQFLTEFDNAVVAQNDIPILEQLEKLLVAATDPVVNISGGINRALGGVGESIRLGFEQQGLGVLLAGADRVAGIDDFIPPSALPPWMGAAEAQRLSREFAGNLGIESDTDLRGAREEVVNRLVTDIQAIQERRQSLTPEDLNLLQQGVRAGVESLVTQLPGLAATFATGSVAPMLALMGVQTGGTAYADARAEGLEPGRAGAYATIDAALEVGTEMLPATRLLRVLGIDEVAETLADTVGGRVRNKLMSRIRDFAVAEVGTEQIATLTQSLNAWMFDLDEELEAAESVGEVADIMLERAAVTAIATVVAGGGQIGIAAGLNQATQAVNTRLNGELTQGQQEQVTLDEINRLASESEMKRIAPEAFNEFLAQNAAPGKDTVFIDGAQLALYLREQGAAVERDPALLLLRERVADAALLGNDVTVSTADFATVVAGTPHFEALRPFMTMSTESVAPFRQDQAKQEAREFIRGLMDEAQESTSQYVEAQEIYEHVREQLVDSGAYDARAAGIMAQIVPAWFTRFAQQQGISVREAYERAGLRIEGPQTGERERLEGELEVLQQARESGYEGDDRAESREWLAAVEKFGPEGMTREARMARAQEMGFDTTVQFFHGTKGEFDTFDPRRMGQSDHGASGRGFYFSQDPGTAGVYAALSPAEGAPNIKPVFLKVQNPYIFEGAVLPQDAEQSQMLTDRVKAAGHDAIYVMDGDVVVEAVVFNSNQVRSINAAFDPDAADSPDLLAQAAYHGTPHSFDRFSLEAIGTGEGAQAYGWGLYFAGNRAVAEWYRDALTHTRPENVTAALIRAGISEETAAAFGDFYVGSGGRGGFSGVAPIDAFAELVNTPHPAEAIEAYRARVREELPALRSAINNIGGNLFQVDIPDDSDLLDWDAPLSEQPEKVREAIRPALNNTDKFALWLGDKYGNNADERIRNQEQIAQDVQDYMAETGNKPPSITKPGMTDIQTTGQEIYRELAKREGSDQAASMYLNSIGIPGLRYLDGTSRGAGDGSRNYVIWDENAVTVQAVNDEIRQAQQLEQRSDKGARGYYDPANAVIRLTEASDLSTFLHEFAHFMLEMERQVGTPILEEINTWFKRNAEEVAAEANGYLAQEQASEVLAQRDLSFFATITREEFLGNPRIVGMSDAADLKPKDITGITDGEPFLDKYTARYRDGAAAVYDGDTVIASYNFDETLVVDKKYRRQGIAEELVYQYRTRFPRLPKAKTRNKVSQRIQEKVWDRIQRELRQQSLRQDSDAFRRWFGDSKVVDENGEPLVVYHGTTAGDITEFKPRFRKNEQLGFGVHFAYDEPFAREYAENPDVARKGKNPAVIPVYISAQNPLEADTIVYEGDPEWTLAYKLAGKNFYYPKDEQGRRGVYLQNAIDATSPQRAQKLIQEAGYDAVIYKARLLTAGTHGFTKGAESRSITVFNPTQIKSAIGNDGTFDPNDPSILRQDDDYAGTHRPPGPDDGAPAHDLTGEGTIYPDDVYSDQAARLYGHGGNHANIDRQAVRVLHKLRGKPDAKVTIYRAVPVNLPGDAPINPGDWVTVTRAYAVEHGEGPLNGEYKIISLEVAAKEIFTNGDSIHEFGYWPGDTFEQTDDTPTSALGPITTDDVTAYLDQGTTGDSAKDAALRRATHEQFARAFEKYLMEGTAPSVELRNAFRAIARWLVEVYRRVRGDLNVRLDDEMRRVFDRLIATEEQIAAAAARGRVKPLFTDAVMAGMTESEYQDYLARNDAVTDKGAETLRDKLIAEITRQTKAWWREELRDKTDEEMVRLQAEPVYRTMAALRGDDMKLDHAMVKAQWGEEVTGKRGRTYTRVPPALRGMTVKGAQGVTPDDAAAFLGFVNGDQMVTAIINAPPIRQAAEQAAQARMIAEHGDILNDGTIEQQADEALQNEERARVLLTELKALAKGTNAPQLERAAIKALAEEQIAALPYSRIFPGKYRRAELRAAQDAAVALANGDREMAARAKLRQVLNFYLGKAAQEARDGVLKITTDMARYNRKNVRTEILKAENGYMEQIDRILSRFEFRRSRSMAEVEALNTWVQNRIEEHGDNLVLSPEVLNETYQTHWKNVPYGQLQGVADSVRNLEHVARYGNKMRVMQEEVDFKTLVTRWVDSIRSSGPMDFTRAQLIDGEGRGVIRQGMAQMTKIPWLASWLDGGERVGLSHDVLVQPLTDALDAKFRLWREVAQPVMDLLDARSKEDVDRHNRKIFIPEIVNNLNTGNYTGAKVLAVALNTGNESNLRKLLLGEGWANPDNEVEISFDNPRLQAVLRHMTRSDWELVQRIWDQMEMLYPQLAEVHRRTSGLTPPKVEASPRTVTVGGEDVELRGGYYPMKYDPVRDDRAETHALRKEAEVDSLFSTVGSIQASVNASATNERTGYYAPVLLDLNVVPNHFDEVIHYITHHDAVRQINKLINNLQVKAAIKEKVGPEEYAQLRPWLNDVAKDGRQLPVKSFIDRTFGRLRFGATLVYMGFKASTGIMQVFGLSNTVAEVGVGNVAKALRDVVGSPAHMREAYRFAEANSKVMAHRSRTMDREMRSAMEALEGRRGVLSRVQEVSMMHIALMQATVDTVTWHAAYIKELEASGDEAKAARYGDWVVEQIQGSGNVKDMAALMRNPNKLHQTLTMFMTFFSALWNAQRDVGRGARTGRLSVAETATMLTWMITIPVLAEMFMRGELDAPDDDEDDRMQRTLTNLALYPTTSIPLVRDFASGFIGDFDYTMSPLAGLLESGISGAKEVVVRGLDEDQEITRAQVRNLTRLIGAAAGIPGVNQAWATADHLAEVMEEGEELTVRELVFGPTRD